MIDHLIVQGPFPRVQPYHFERLTHISISRFSASKSKPATTFIDSPLTNAQVEVRYIGGATPGNAGGLLEMTIPVASAIIGQNYAHAGLESIQWEIECCALLVQVILVALGFRTDEVTNYMNFSEVQLCEMTWHTPTASTKARKSLQSRTVNFFESMNKLSSFHDIAISDVDYRRKNGHPCLLVSLKNGDEFRQYGKIDQVILRSKKGRKRYMVVPALSEHLPELLTSIETHVRNEVRLGVKSLKELNLLHPNNWERNAMLSAIQTLWGKLGFEIKEFSHANGKTRKELSKEAEVTLAKYLAGNFNLRNELPTHTFTRHRQAIKEYCDGTDIAAHPRGSKHRTSLSHQLHYAHRWEPKGMLRQLVLCEETGPGILLDLERGLTFIRDGEIPAIENEEELNDWLRRWRGFAEKERLYRLMQDDENDSPSDK